MPNVLDVDPASLSSFAVVPVSILAMCGIFLELLSRGVSLSWRWEQVSGALADRGPDRLRTREVQIRDDGEKKVLGFTNVFDTILHSS